MGQTSGWWPGPWRPPESIALSAPRPADFDAFWDAKLQALAAIPANPVLASVAIGNTNLAYSKLTLDNIWGTHIQGQLARPVAGGKFPALLIVQWAGVYPLQPSWVTERAQEGWLVLNIQAHDLPIDLPESFYNEQAAGPLKDYYDIGNDDRDESYFLRMYLSCYRAAEYLTQRADWDGKTLVVLGQSQGGHAVVDDGGAASKNFGGAGDCACRLRHAGDRNRAGARVAELVCARRGQRPGASARRQPVF
jgi:cephalosporin-C deacetylase